MSSFSRPNPNRFQAELNDSHRSFLKRQSAPNIPIQAIGLSLYEQLPPSKPSDPTDPVETPGTKVTRTQWLDLSSLEMANLVGKNILIVDEVDDTRTTLEYAVRELQKDVETAAQKLGSDEKTQFSIFVLHAHHQNKDKPKKGHLPQEMMDDGRYLAARTVSDVWICYPWEATDIDEHDKLAASQAKY
ncbi:MAG: hypothetical protein LQ346_006789 [Caloplaca aetnensis]|nr:MAG: hypothetical protein LQ346_006789 [Caloplaca aetnensis]